MSLMCWSWKRVYLNVKRWEIKYEVLKFSKLSQQKAMMCHQMSVSSGKWWRGLSQAPVVKKIFIFSSLLFLWSILWDKERVGPILNIQVALISSLTTILFYRKGFCDSFLVHIFAWQALIFLNEIGPFHVCSMSTSLKNNNRNNKLYILCRDWNTRTVIWICYNTSIKRTIHSKKIGWGSKPDLIAALPKWTVPNFCQPLLAILPAKATEGLSNVFR